MTEKITVEQNYDTNNNLIGYSLYRELDYLVDSCKRFNMRKFELTDDFLNLSITRVELINRDNKFYLKLSYGNI